MMGRSARLHRHPAWRQLFCPSLECAASENATFYNRTAHIQHARRYHFLCEIKADRSKLFHDFPPVQIDDSASQSWHSMPCDFNVASGRGSPLHLKNSSAALKASVDEKSTL
jgi:hypothetical protein